jgi:hypothetical protein
VARHAEHDARGADEDGEAESTSLSPGSFVSVLHCSALERFCTVISVHTPVVLSKAMSIQLIGVILLTIARRLGSDVRQPA